MANTLGTVAGTMVLIQDILSTLLVKFPIISQITRDSSSANAKFNQLIVSRVIVPTTAIEHDPVAGYVATNRTAVDVPITINKQAEHTFTVTDREQSTTARNLRQEFVETAAHALGTKIVTDLFGVVLAASYPLLYSSTSANFDAADVRRIKTLLNKAGVPDVGRFLVTNSDFAEGLGLDNIIIANPNGFNQGGIGSGNLPPMIHGFSPSEFATMPTNAQQLGGIAGNREAIVMASRLPDVPATSAEIPGVIVSITEPNTGFTVQYRSWYQMNPPQAFEVITVMYGFNVGLSETGLSKRLVRIVGV